MTTGKRSVRTKLEKITPDNSKDWLTRELWSAKESILLLFDYIPPDGVNDMDIRDVIELLPKRLHKRAWTGWMEMQKAIRTGELPVVGEPTRH